jgi:hypothetical protein
MRLAVGSRDRELRVLFDPRLMQPSDQVTRQERAIRRSAQHPRNVRTVGRGPVERRQNAGEWSWKIGDAVWYHRQPKRRKTRRITIGVEDQAVALRRQARDHAIEDGAAADLAHRLVAAAHPAREAAGEQYAGRLRRVS